ncbi:MAG TPA: CotH kinase family protein [Marinagarivorans sp.]
MLITVKNCRHPAPQRQSYQRSRGWLSRPNPLPLFSRGEKSFAIDLDSNDAGVDIHGYDELKLNNAHDDPSAMRETLFSNLAGHSIPSARANLVKLVINGHDFGFYTNLKKLEKGHVDTAFLIKTTAICQLVQVNFKTAVINLSFLQASPHLFKIMAPC